jgi:hypothetical protein
MKTARMDAALAREELYVRWLMEQRKYTFKEALAYATGGQAKLDGLRAAGRPQTARERRAAREANFTPTERRLMNADQCCAVKGCLYPRAHSGPHKVVRDLSGPPLEVATRGNRTKPGNDHNPGALHTQNARPSLVDTAESSEQRQAKG